MAWNAATALHMCGRRKMRMEFTDEIVALFAVLQDLWLYDFPADGLLIYFYFSFTSRMRFSACGFRACVNIPCKAVYSNVFDPYTNISSVFHIKRSSIELICGWLNCPSIRPLVKLCEAKRQPKVVKC